MGQSDVLAILKKKRDWCTAKDIYSELDISLSTVRHNLSKLYYWRYILRRVSPKNTWWYEWRVK